MTMREILFRGKEIGADRWVHGSLDIHKSGVVVIMSEEIVTSIYARVDPDTIGQYTGLTDKNGTKIFEGDIVRYAIYPPDQFVYGVVNYKDGVYRIGDQGCALCVCAADGIEEYRLKVIGNVHDNPELMEDK